MVTIKGLSHEDIPCPYALLGDMDTIERDPSLRTQLSAKTESCSLRGLPFLDDSSCPCITLTVIHK